MSSNSENEKKNLGIGEARQEYTRRLAFQIADDAARADIETWCPSFTNDGREPVTTDEIRAAWYDVSRPDEEGARFVSVAVRYLLLRGRIEQHPLKRTWMRIIG